MAERGKTANISLFKDRPMYGHIRTAFHSELLYKILQRELQDGGNGLWYIFCVDKKAWNLKIPVQKKTFKQMFKG